MKKANITLTESQFEIVRNALIRSGEIRLSNYITRVANKTFVTKDMIEDEERMIRFRYDQPNRSVAIPVVTNPVMDDDLDFQRAIENYERDYE